MELEFFLPMIPPTVTHQEKKARIVWKDGKPVPQYYEPSPLAAARAKLTAHLAKHAPEKPMRGGVLLVVKWLFPLDQAGRHYDGEYRITKPDTDNLQKLLKDVMTQLGYWKDDAQVCSEHSEKFWAARPGIYIHAMEVIDLEAVGGID